MNKDLCCAPPRAEESGMPLASHVMPEPNSALTASMSRMDEQVLLPGGQFFMGADDTEGWPADAEGPVRKVELRPFLMDVTAVTNRQFAEFISATGYKTDAEKFGWSYVFILQLPKSRREGNFAARTPQAPWWVGIKQARWDQPEGPGFSLDNRWDHPVVHVSWFDATAFAHWASKRLPTEAEWEYAARGGLVQKRYPWGDELTPGGKHMCNIWQGKFPKENRPEDGYLWTAPVKAYPPNEFGIYEMSGNVWEWCADWWGISWNTADVLNNPLGPAIGTNRVIRGGSFLCHKSYCNRYRVGARSHNTPDSTTSHTGFRTVASVPIL